MLGGPPRDGGNPRVNSSPRAQAPDQQDWAMTLPDHSDNADTSQPVSINPARSGELNLNQSVIHSSWTHGLLCENFHPDLLPATSMHF